MATIKGAGAEPVALKLEVVVLGVFDVERASERRSPEEAAAAADHYMDEVIHVLPR